MVNTMMSVISLVIFFGMFSDDDIDHFIELLNDLLNISFLSVKRKCHARNPLLLGLPDRKGHNIKITIAKS